MASFPLFCFVALRCCTAVPDGSSPNGAVCVSSYEQFSPRLFIVDSLRVSDLLATHGAV